MAPFDGFPDNSEYTQVPNLLFGQTLEEIDDPLALKCFLRVLWLHSQKKSSPAILTKNELMADETLIIVVSTPGTSTEAALGDALDTIVRLGLLLQMKVDSARGVFDVYVPNTQKGRQDAQKLKDTRPDVSVTDVPAAAHRPKIFQLYEECIGIITPMVAELLKDAEQQYPETWIEEAFRQAVTGNKRSWRYIEAILKRWKTEGRDDGEPWRHSERVDAREWIRRHGFPGT